MQVSTERLKQLTGSGLSDFVAPSFVETQELAKECLEYRRLRELKYQQAKSEFTVSCPPPVTLRDQMAMAALSCSEWTDTRMVHQNVLVMAKSCYRMADAMLKAREEKND